MTRNVNAAAAAALLLALGAVPARAQTAAATDRARGIPAGLALPTFGVAVAEEPIALGTNPAGVGFVRELAFQYLHEQDVPDGWSADGIYLAQTLLGAVGLGFSHEWIRPDPAALARYRRTRLGLAFGDGRSTSFGIAKTWTSSPDGAVADADGWDFGVTWRPRRYLSVGAAMLGRGDRQGEVRLPVRYDLGLATRLWNDALTLSADLLADDRARNDFDPRHVALGAAVETPLGVALGVQVQVPVQDLPGPGGDVTGLATLTWNGPYSGLTAGAHALPDRTGWLAGVRGSTERYRAPVVGRQAPTVDVDDELRRERSLFFGIGERDPFGALVERLGQIRDDDAVAAVLLRIDGLPVGAGRVEELRSLVGEIRARKPVLAYLTGGGTREYWLASAANVVAAPPGAALMVNGISTTQLFLRDVLARAGVTFEVVRAGAYKTATEPLVRSEPSPESREMTDALLDDVFARLVADLAEARRLPPEGIRALLDQGLFSADEAREAGLLDAVAWPDELEGLLRRLSHRPVQEAGGYRPPRDRHAQRWGAPPVVQLLRLEGTITRGESRDAGPLADAVAGAESLAAAIRRAADDRRVRAIVLRIESPGGDALASDLVWRALVQAREKGKVVVASLGDVAASGGYLAAAGADVIVAEPSTITGSIGVFSAKPELSGLLGMLGIGRAAYTRGENAQLDAVLKPWSASERAAVERQIEAIYRVFLDRVAEGRRLSREEVEAVAGGRVWTGRQALERRLVDRLGGLAEAIAVARERAGLDPDDLVEVRREDGARGVLARIAPPVPQPPLGAALLAAAPQLRVLALLEEMGPVLALPVEWFPEEPTR